jgi:translation initiation factor IF-1
MSPDRAKSAVVAVADSAAAVAANIVAAIIATNRTQHFASEVWVNQPRFSFLQLCPQKSAGRGAVFLQTFEKGKMIQTKEQHIEIEGVIATVLPGTMFRVELANKHTVLATICGKMRKRWVRLTVGDRVKMEMSPYDLDKARITWRLK